MKIAENQRKSEHAGNTQPASKCGTTLVGIGSHPHPAAGCGHGYSCELLRQLQEDRDFGFGVECHARPATGTEVRANSA